MKNIQVFLFSLFLLVFTNSAFALANVECLKVDSQTKVNKCANEILENTPFIAPALDVMLTDESAPVAEYMINTAVTNSDEDKVHLTPRSGTENLVTKYRDSFTKGVGSVFLIIASIFSLYLIYISQFTAEFLGKKTSDFVYLAIKFLIVFYLLGLGKIFPLVFGFVIGSWLLLISFATWISPSFIAVTAVDVGYETTQAEALASSQFATIFEAEVKNSAALWLLESKSYATYDFNKVENFKRYLVPSPFTECMKQSAPASKFEATTVMNGYVQKSKDCFDKIGKFQILDYGSLNYYGDDESVKARLIEIVDYAHEVAFDSIRLMCNKALSIDDRRAKWSSQNNVNPVAYEQCINRNLNGEVLTGKDGEIQFFDGNDDVTQDSIKALIAQAMQSYISAATEFVANKAKVAIEFQKTDAIDSNIGSFLMGFNRVLDAGDKIDAQISEEFNKKIAVKESTQLSGMNDDKAGLDSLGDITKLGQSLTSRNTQKVFDIDKSIEALVNGSDKEIQERRVKSTVEYLSNSLLGNYYSISGFSFEDCTKAVNTCTAPILNQSAALFKSGLNMLQKYWEYYVVGSVIKNYFKDSETDRGKMIARNVSSFNFIVGLALAVCGSLLLVGGLFFPLLFIARLGAIVTGLASFLIIIVLKIFMLIAPHSVNTDHKKTSESLTDMSLSLIWKFIEPSLIFIVGLFSMALHSLISTVVGLVVWAICSPLMLNTSPLATLSGVVFTAIIFQFVSVKIQYEIAIALLNGLDTFEEEFKVESIVKHAQNALDTYQEVESKFKSVSSKLMRD
ncbi:hypothetical protein AO073_01395 [Pseudomonas syringae ICMP 11293]|uniref:hypothetical protein n=1 Tax=Pseudomonas syringae TaxID=317 RepID=UPI00072FBCB0|nr:hypothetical protein [Pseudomonas syringae]KTB91555.1 hypothetical protein AO073_01395 [Pseudomonas syringae ICMP 11293]